MLSAPLAALNYHQVNHIQSLTFNAFFGQPAFNAPLAVNQVHSDGILRNQVLSEALGAVGGAVLAAGAAEADLQMGEAALEEAFHVGIDQGIDMVQEAEDLAVLLQELDDRRIQAGELLEPFVLPGIVHAPAVEHIPAPVSGRILGNPLLEGKTVNSHRQG